MIVKCLYDDVEKEISPVIQSHDPDRIEIEIDNSIFEIEPLMEGFRIKEKTGRLIFVAAEAKDDFAIFTGFLDEH